MECLKCGHRMPDRADKCLYCGWIRGEVISRTGTEPGPSATSSEKTGKNISPIQATPKEFRYEKIEDLPEDLRVKVEEMLKKGENRSVEIKTSVSKFPDSLDSIRSKKKKMSFLSALKILLKKD